mmetsp:Transcript_88448/g.253350  ORF Transcript_88448/g.253350 Transcript_88448/m.253350 type:complete len:311 (-) Transcript_88448:301-1233(-)
MMRAWFVAFALPLWSAMADSSTAERTSLRGSSPAAKPDAAAAVAEISFAQVGAQWGHHHHWHHHHGYHHHHWDHHHWYALDAVLGNDTVNASTEAVDNAGFWSGVFSEPEMMRSFAVWVGSMDNETRLIWEESVPEALNSSSMVQDGSRGQAEKDVDEGNAVSFWDVVFGADEATQSFAAWLAEMGNETRQAWERNVSEVSFAEVGAQWWPSWHHHWHDDYHHHNHHHWHHWFSEYASSGLSAAARVESQASFAEVATQWWHNGWDHHHDDHHDDHHDHWHHWYASAGPAGKSSASTSAEAGGDRRLVSI